MNIFSRITARTMAQNKTRTVVTIIGIILSTAMITALTTFGVSFRSFLVDYSITRDGCWHVAGYGLSARDAKSLADMEEVKNAAQVTELGYALFEQVQKQSPMMPYLYVQALSEEALQMLPINLEEGRMPENAGEVIVPTYLLANENEDNITKVGDTLELALGERTFEGEHLGQNVEYMSEEDGFKETFTVQKTETFTVVGVYNRCTWSLHMGYGGAGYEVFAGPAERSGEYQDVFLELADPRNVYKVAETHFQKAGYGYTVNYSLLRWLGVSDNDNFYRVVAGLFVILVIIIMTASVLLIYNAFSISLRERTTQFGLLSSIGATKKQLRRSMGFEAVAVSCIGIPLGILAGVGGIGVTLHYIGKGITVWIHGIETGIPLVVSPGSILAAAAVAFVTVMISVWIPSRRIKKISPMEAIRANTDIKISSKEVKTAKWVTRVFGLEGMLAEKNYKRDKRKYRTTVLSLTMSIVLFATAALFQEYLMQTGAFVLEAPQIDLEYHYYEYEGQDSEEAARVDKVIREAKYVDSVASFHKTYLTLEIPKEWMADGASGAYELGSLKSDDHTFIQMSVAAVSDDAFREFAAGRHIDVSDYEETDSLRLMYVNEAGVYNAETQRYERIAFLNGEKDIPLPCGTIEYEEENVKFVQTGQALLGDAVLEKPEELEYLTNELLAIIPESMFLKFQGQFQEDAGYTVYNIRSKQPEKAYEEIESALKERELTECGYLNNLTQEYETDRNALMAVKVLSYGFIVLLSLIAVANVFNTVTTNLLLRRREFAMLRSMGMSPKGLYRMMDYECLIYGMRAIIYGVLLSVLVSLAIYRVIGIGADMHLIIPWGYLIAAILGVLLVVFVTMLYTMYKIRKNRIVDELKMN